MEGIINIDKLNELLSNKKYIYSSDLHCLSRYTINKLVTYKVLSPKDKKGRYTILSDAYKLKNYDFNLELETLKKTYLYFKTTENYEYAEFYLNKYIALCEKNNMSGHHYYWKQDLHLNQSMNKFTNSVKARSLGLIEKFQSEINNGENETALETAQKFLAITNGENLYSYLLSGIAYNKLKKDEETEFYLTKAFEIFPESPSIFSELAKLHIRQKKYDDALDNLSLLLEIDGKNFNGYVMLYKVYYLNGEYDRAVETYNLALKKISSKLIKFYNIKIQSFEKSLFYQHNERLNHIKSIVNNEELSSLSRIRKINNFISSVDDCSHNKVLLLFDTLDLLSEEDKQIYDETLREYDMEKAKPYIKKIDTMRREYNGN